MAIANRTCVSFCNQPKAQFGYLRSPEVAKLCLRLIAETDATGESRRYVVAFSRFAGGCIWLRQESLRHILASAGYAPGTIAVNVTWMERGFNARQTHRSMYPSIFNRFRAMLCVLGEILVGNCNFFTPLHLTPPLRCSDWNFGKKFGPHKTWIMGLPGSEDSLTIGWAVLTQYQCVTDEQTDGQTYVQPVAKTCFNIADARNKNLAIGNRSRVSCINTYHA